MRERTFGLRLLPFERFLVPGFGLDWEPGPGDIARAGTLGGGPGSAAGDLLCIDLCEVGGACMVVNVLEAEKGLQTAPGRWAWPS